MFAKLCAKRNKKGFTLAELLIVVAILGVLVAIAIPVFTSSLTNAAEAVDDANYRGALAGVSVAKLGDQYANLASTDIPQDGDYYQTDGTWGTTGNKVTAKSGGSQADYPDHTKGQVLQYSLAAGLKWVDK